MVRTDSGGLPDAVDVYVGARVRALRKLRGISQTALGDHIGLTFQQVQKYERGFNRISASVLYRIAGALDTVPAEFFVGLPDPRQGQGHAELTVRPMAPIDGLLGVSGGAAMAETFPKLKTNLRRVLVDLVRVLAAESGSQ
jgi:transcriptional regulator with XRE-family HTH domain